MFIKKSMLSLELETMEIGLKKQIAEFENSNSARLCEHYVTVKVYLWMILGYFKQGRLGKAGSKYVINRLRLRDSLRHFITFAAPIDSLVCKKQMTASFADDGEQTQNSSN
jgi:hypothetical protein